VLFGAIGPVDGALGARFGPVGAPLGGHGLRFGALCVVAGALRVLLGRFALELRVAGLLAREVALSFCFAGPGDGLLAFPLGLLGSRERVLGALAGLL
jgi:hypothetical protein